jgi:hypothetical protein
LPGGALPQADRRRLKQLDQLLFHAVGDAEAKLLRRFVVLEDDPGPCSGQLDRPGDNGVQHHLEIQRRADRSADFAERRELLHRPRQLGCPCSQLGEQADVLDRDDRLVGERLEERDLLGRKRSPLPPADRDGADCDTLPQHGHAQDGAPERRDLAMLVLRIRSDVSLLDAARENGPAGEGASAGRPRKEPLEGFAF